MLGLFDGNKFQDKIDNQRNGTNASRNKPLLYGESIISINSEGNTAKSDEDNLQRDDN